MITSTAYATLNSLARRGVLTMGQLTELIIGRSAKVPTMVRTFARPVIEELLSIGLIEVFDVDGDRSCAITGLGIRYLADVEKDGDQKEVA